MTRYDLSVEEEYPDRVIVMRQGLRFSVKGWLVIPLCLVILGVAACGEDPQELFETAQFEELQNNHSHARELYERVIRADPDSEIAKKAKARLKELENKERN